MFKTVKRIVDWCGEFKGRLYAGFAFPFLSHIFAALPLMIAAYTVGLLIDAEKTGMAFDTGWIWKCIVLQIVLVLLRFFFDYLRARYQESISYELTARDRLAVGDALKRVSLGYFQQMSAGSILNSITTGLGTLENMGIRMIDNFVGGYLNFLVIFIGLAAFSPVTALIALAAAALSFLCLLMISHYSAQNAPVEAAANRDLTGAILEYARGLSVVKSFGQSGTAMVSARQCAASAGAEMRQRGAGAGGKPDVPEGTNGLFHGAGLSFLFLQYFCQPGAYQRQRAYPQRYQRRDGSAGRAAGRASD